MGKSEPHMVRAWENGRPARTVSFVLAVAADVFPMCVGSLPVCGGVSRGT